MKSTLSIYFKNGNVFAYEVNNATKAREHANKIWQHGYRHTDVEAQTTEWFGPHYIDKIKWTNDNTLLATKYISETS